MTLGDQPEAAGEDAGKRYAADALHPPADSLLTESSRALDSAYGWLRKAGAATVSFLDRQKRLAWCERAIRELREDRDVVLEVIGREVYRAYREGRIEDGRLPVSEELLAHCRKVEDYDTRIEAQKLLRNRVGEGRR